MIVLSELMNPIWLLGLSKMIVLSWKKRSPSMMKSREMFDILSMPRMQFLRL